MVDGGLVLCELFCDIKCTALEYNSNCVFIDANYSMGIISNTVNFVHHKPSNGIEILPWYFEVAITTGLSLMHEHPEAAVVKIFHGRWQHR